MISLRLVRRAIVVAGLLALAAVYVINEVPPDTGGSGALNLRGGPAQCYDPADIDSGTVLPPRPGWENQYIVVEFTRLPTPAERTRMREDLDREIEFIQSIPDRSYEISVDTSYWTRALQYFMAAVPPARCIAPPRGEDKGFDLLDFATQLPGFDSTTQRLTLYVRFYRTVPITTQRARLNPIIVGNLDSVPAYNGEWRVVVDKDKEQLLKDVEGIQWVRSDSFAPVEDVDEARRVIGLPGDYANTGDSTVVAQWELCHPAVTPPHAHPDFEQRARVGIPPAQCGINSPTDASGNVVGNSNRHATRVAGIVIGNGGQSTMDGASPGQFRGVASGSRLVSYSVVDAPDFGAEYLNAVANDAVISTNSWGPKAGDYYFESKVELYPYRASFYDSIASSRDSGGWPTGPGRSLLIVASAGNQGAMTDTGGVKRSFFETVRIRNSAKNVLTVGNISTGLGQAEEMPAFDSGRGPTGDGRIKPDLVAPGSELKAGLPEIGEGIRATVYPNNANSLFYHARWGTSFSTPVVAGAAALVSTTVRRGACARNPDSSEFRALLIQSAKDLVDASDDAELAAVRDSRHREGQSILQLLSSTQQNLVPTFKPPTPSGQPLDDPPVQQPLIGPDYVFGFGLVRPAEADALAAGGHFVSDELSDGVVEYPIVLDPSMLNAAGQLQVTLTWDDPPYPLMAEPDPLTGLLQNDLDLVLVDPNGRHYFPWKLDPDLPAEPATRAWREQSDSPDGDDALGDHLNTVEQVTLKPDLALLGETWTIRVSGRRMRLPPQPYTLASRMIQPAVPCGPVPNVKRAAATPPPHFDETTRVLLIIALVILLLLLLWLGELVYAHYRPQGRNYAIGMVLVAWSFVLVVALVLWSALTGEPGANG